MSAPRVTREMPQRYRLEAGRCTNCRKLTFPPRRVCPSCRGQAFETIALSGEGKLVSWTIQHVVPGGFALQAPYVVGIVELIEGVRVTAQIVDCDPRALEAGTQLRHVMRRVLADGADGIIQYGYKFVPV
jgi:uncharacterized OB-fold protein